MNSIWQARSIVWTDDTLYVARGELIVETIPLHEITSIDEMNGGPDVENLSQTSALSRRSPSFVKKVLEVDCADLEGKGKIVSRGHHHTILTLKTKSDGFNFGRIYYFQPCTETSGRDTASLLSNAARIAKSRVEQKTRFQTSQDLVSSFQQSSIFQMTVAALIMLVKVLYLKIVCIKLSIAMHDNIFS